MKFSRQPSRGRDASRLTYRLWDFTGTAMLNLFMLLFLLAYLSPLPFMVIASLTPHDQFLDPNAPILPSKRVKFNYEGKDRIVYQVPTEDGIKHWALYKPSRQSSQFIDPEHPESGPIVWKGNWRMLKANYEFAPRLDGAGPLRILVSVILPQSIPVVVTVALLHFFYIWNETRLSSLYLGISPHRQMISFAIQRNQTYFFTPEALMVGALVVMVVPVIVLLISQRFFMQDMIVTQIEK